MTTSETKTYIITGGAGFIGFNLCKHLLDQGHKVAVIDNFWTSARHHRRLMEKWHRENPSFTLLDADIRDLTYQQWKQNLPESCDGIFHLACPASPVHYQDLPYDTFETATLGTDRVLTLALAMYACVPRIILASTSEVYGEPMVSPQPETYRGNTSCTGPRSMYDEGKRGMEAMALAHQAQFGTNIGIVRIFNTYGPEMSPSDGRVISNFITKMLSGERPTIYGDGSQKRSFCYVDDLVEGLILMMQADAEVTGPINLGNPEEITINHLAGVTDAEIHGYMNPSKPQSELVHYEPAREDDPTHRCPDITLARQILGWHPKTHLSTGLRRTIKYFTETKIHR